MTDFGAGPLLTRDFDFEVTTTGDLEITRGSDELQKDIALQLSINLQELIGSPKYENSAARISSRTRETLNADPRIDTVLDINVRFLNTADTAEIIANTTTDQGEQELVFTI